MRVGILTAAVAIVCAAPAAAQARFDAAAAQIRFDALIEKIGQQDMRLIVTDTPPPEMPRVPTILLPRAALSAIRTEQELDAALSVLVVDLFNPTVDPRGSGPTVGDYLGLAAYAAAVETIDPPNPHDLRNIRDTRIGGIDLNDPRRMPEKATISPRGRLLLGYLRRTRSCTGAAMDVLARFARTPTLADSRLARLVTQTRSDLGAAVMPPDHSCVTAAAR